jgi:adenylate cyclase
VNVAARLEALAEPGGVCISRTVRDHIRDKLPYALHDMGEQSVKNIARPVRAYAMGAAAVASTPLVAAQAQPEPARRSIIPQRAVIAASLLAAIGFAIVAWWAWPKGNSPALSVQAPAAASRQIPPAVASTPAPRLSIVVLPFANLSKDPDQEYFADGITDDLGGPTPSRFAIIKIRWQTRPLSRRAKRRSSAGVTSIVISLPILARYT